MLIKKKSEKSPTKKIPSCITNSLNELLQKKSFHLSLILSCKTKEGFCGIKNTFNYFQKKVFFLNHEEKFALISRVKIINHKIYIYGNHSTAKIS